MNNTTTAHCFSIVERVTSCLATAVVLAPALLTLPSNRCICHSGYNLLPFRLDEHSSPYMDNTTSTAQPSPGSCILYGTEAFISLQVACVQREKGTQKQKKSLIFSVLVSYRTEVHYAAYHSTWCNHQIGGGFC
jgi:hypothetical protein